MRVFPFSNSALYKATECPAESAAGQAEVAYTTRHHFGRELRLLKPVEYKRVFDGASRVSTRYLTLLARCNELGYPRLGLAIAKKSVKQAVNRNRIKRQVRESFRHNQHQLGGIDIVVLAKSGIAEWDWSELRSMLDSKWRELRKRCKEC